jgi:Tfp pilus assembly protein PilO
MQQLYTQALPKNKKSNSSIGLFLLCFFIAVVLFIFLTFPKFSDWKTGKQAVVTNQQTLAKTQNEADTVTSEMSQVNSPDLNKAALAVPGQSDIANLYASIEEMSNAANVKLTSLQAIENVAGSTTLATPNASAADAVDANGNPVVPPSLTVPPVPAGLQTVNVTVDATGNYSAIEQMISSIYHSLRIINVQKITISTYQGNGGTQTNISSTDPELNLQLQLLTYYSK